ncbi:MAG: hypothetical protein ACI835_000996, partial [Planctomycetota bacterium]
TAYLDCGLGLLADAIGSVQALTQSGQSKH